MAPTVARECRVDIRMEVTATGCCNNFAGADKGVVAVDCTEEVCTDVFLLRLRFLLRLERPR